MNRDEVPLPEGFRLALDPDVRRPSWKVAVGGAPLRVLRLGDTGARMIDRWEGGATVGRSAPAGRFARRLVDAGIAHPRPPAGPSPDVAFVVPVRDHEAGLRATLASLAFTSSFAGPPGGPNVVVVDDGSAVPAGHRNPLPSDVKVLREELPRGPAAARNSGWRAAESEIVVFLDAECVPTGDWLSVLLPHFADPAVAAVAPRIVSSVRGRDALHVYETLRSSLDLGEREAPVRPGSRVQYVPTACLAVRREALEQIGGFDETLRFGEDVDLVWKLNDAGWSVRYEPRASVTHPPRPNLPAWLRQRFDYGRSAAPLARRHGSDVAPLAVSPWSIGVWALVAGGYPAAGAALTAATAAVLSRRAGGERETAIELARLVARGNLLAGAQLAEAVRRAWLLPSIAAMALLPAGPPRRRAAAVIGAAFAAPFVEWVSRRPQVDPVRWVALRDADDLAYQTGVWFGAVSSRSVRALLPRF